MKWIFSVLLIVNVAILLWPSGDKRSLNAVFSGQSAPAAGGFGGSVAGDPPINPKDLLLLSEKISVDQQEKTVSVAGPAVSDRRATEFGAPQTARPPQALAKAGVGDRHCLRIGPFFERQERNRAQTFVASFDVPVSTQLVDGRTVRSWRAFLGPFENDAQRDEAENRAIKAGFSKSRKGDKQKNSEKIVSLGLFSTKKSAQRVQAKTRFSTLRVQIREEMTQLPSTNWLKVEEPGLSIHELRMIDSTNWGENQVNVREIVCDG